MSFPALSEIVRHFAPGWFAAVMGTGVLAMTTHTLAERWPLLAGLAQALHLFNSLFCAVLAPLWLGRWLFFRQAAVQTLRHPIQASFYPTFPIALLVLSAQWRTVGGASDLPLVLWWLGTALMLAFSFAILFGIFRGEHLTVDHVTPAKFIPAVGLVVIPLAGAPLLPALSGAAREAALLLNLVGLGSGALMYVGLLGMTLQRQYLHRPATGALTPTVWIHLAPLGVVPLSLLGVVEQLPLPAVREAATVLMLVFWGCGVWWLVMAGLLTLAAWRAGELPFALSWWGFTFPLGAFVAEGLRLAPLSGSAGVFALAVAAWGLLCALWLLTLWRTLLGAIRGSIFLPAP